MGFVKTFYVAMLGYQSVSCPFHITLNPFSGDPRPECPLAATFRENINPTCALRNVATPKLLTLTLEDFGKCDQFAHRTVRNLATPKSLT